MPLPDRALAGAPAGKLAIRVGQHSAKGAGKEINQDFHGLCLPAEPQLSSKGIAIALADGIGSSSVSHVASESAVKSFLEDYYCTPDAWSVRTSAECVLAAANSWLHSQTHHSVYRYERERGYICTLSALVLKAGTAHLLHVGDSRIYRLREGRMEPLTSDHRLTVAEGESYLNRALGMGAQVEIDYRSLSLDPGDIFVLATDGVHEHVAPSFIVGAIGDGRGDLDAAAGRIVREAFAQGGRDDATVQIVRIDALPPPAGADPCREFAELPPPPLLRPRMHFDGYHILRELHGSSRSHIYLAEEEESGALVALKIPSMDLRQDRAYLERFMLEEWIARRIDSAHVLKPRTQTRQRHYLYVVTEYVEGRTLAQWMIDHPAPDLETVRDIVEQIARGLRAFHRLEMLHQDLRPENVMIDGSGTVKIIDFGATRVAGLAEAASNQPHILGTYQYTAPEYFLGEPGTPRSDLFSLGVIVYQMLSGRLPYGAEVGKCRTRAAQRKLRYESVLDENRAIPAWIDAALAKAVHPDPYKRYEELSEFVHDLRHPNNALLGKAPPPLIERHPVLFWKCMSFVLALAVIALLGLHTVSK